MRSGLWLFKFDGFNGWNGKDHGMPNISSVQDWDHGPEGPSSPLNHMSVARPGGEGACSPLARSGGPAGRDRAVRHPAASTPRRRPTHGGSARLVFAHSPFGVAVTADGAPATTSSSTLTGLPEPATLGAYTAYVAWAATTDLSHWHRLGAVTNGTTTRRSRRAQQVPAGHHRRGGATADRTAGPTILHGTVAQHAGCSRFLTHPLFRGIPP